jgi:Flp pilus assembly protein TadD
MWDKSIRHYKKALEFHPNEPIFLEKLGSLLLNCPDISFRNVEAGRIYSERAYIHVRSTPRTTISAGRNLAIAFASQGEFQNAEMVINQTLDMARRENFSEAHMAILEEVSQQIKKQSMQ